MFKKGIKSIKKGIPPSFMLYGPSGIGKTEIARRLARLTDSPFFKVEASKFTEVGYVGRDVESMIRDILEVTVTLLKSREQESVKEKAWKIAEERMLERKRRQKGWNASSLRPLGEFSTRPTTGGEVYVP